MNLIGPVHHRLQAVLLRLPQFPCPVDALKQHDVLANAGFAQPQGFFQTRHGQGIGIGQRPGHGQQAVTIGIGLDHGQQFRIGSVAPGERQIVPQGRKVNPRARAGQGLAHA